MNYNWGLNQYSGDMEAATNKSIRFFLIPQLTADYPQEDTKARSVVCNPGDVKQFSAVGYFFGKRLYQNLHSPIGLIGSSWSGTPAEVWTPAEIVDNDTTLKKAAMKRSPAEGRPVNPVSTYNAILHPLINYSIAGVIWYQGEANVGAAKTYSSLFSVCQKTPHPFINNSLRKK